MLREDRPAPHVLLVDDAEDTREMYSEYFEYAGLRVSHAVDGEHALWKVITLVPDVVVMDLAMPILDGWDATHEIKKHRKTRHIPVIVLTGHATDAAMKKRAEDAGADYVLAKPCAPASLLAVIQSVVGR